MSFSLNFLFYSSISFVFSLLFAYLSEFWDTATSIEVAVVNFLSLEDYFLKDELSLVRTCGWEGLVGAKILDCILLLLASTKVYTFTVFYELWLHYYQFYLTWSGDIFYSTDADSLNVNLAFLSGHLSRPTSYSFGFFKR